MRPSSHTLHTVRAKNRKSRSRGAAKQPGTGDGKASEARGGEGREFDRIDWIRRQPAAPGAKKLLLAVGDDAAAWRPRAGHSVVLSVDTQVDGVHFRRDWMTLREIGRRAVAASVSDLAAMGATPTCVLLALVLEKGTTTSKFRQLFRGLEEGAAACGAAIAGGNLATGPLSITVTAVGECLPNQLLRRSGSRAGDEVWVTGSPGLAGLGCEALEKECLRQAGLRRKDASAIRRAVRGYKAPQARVAEARWIGRTWKPHAMVDISDGLVADLGHLVDSNSTQARIPLGAELEEEALATLPHLAPIAAFLNHSPADVLARASDDYELCFTAAAAAATTRRAAAFRGAFDVPLTRIGRVVETPGVRLLRAGRPVQKLTDGGWKHG